MPNLKKKGPKRVSFLVLYADLGLTVILSNHSPKAFTFPENNPLSSILPSTICSSWSKFEISKFLTSSMINRCRLPFHATTLVLKSVICSSPSLLNGLTKLFNVWRKRSLARTSAPWASEPASVDSWAIKSSWIPAINMAVPWVVLLFHTGQDWKCLSSKKALITVFSIASFVI